MLDQLQQIALNYWPLAASFIVTFGIVHGLKQPFLKIQGDIWIFSKQRLAIRALAFIVGFIVTYAAMIAFTDNPQKIINYSAFFVGIANPSAYWFLMIYLRIRHPETYSKLQLALSKGVGQ